MRFSFLLLPLALLAACAQPPINRQANDPLPVAQVDLTRYLGLWHEAARLPNQFERDCVSATAEYARRPDGLISVHNVCTQADGKKRDILGRAKPAGATGEGKLKVSFFGPFWADYWVLEHADDYAWSIVGEPSGCYLWLLTRAEQISPEDRAVFDARLRALGYDT